MSTNNLRQRGRALEDIFFANQDEVLLQRLREKSAREENKALLKQSTGIEQDEVIDTILELGLSAENIVAFTLLPLVEVAWADGTLQQNEREAILKAAHEAGIQEGGTSRELLERWLDHRPKAEMFDAWQLYAASLSSSLGPEAARDLRDSMMKRAREVAESAGGILGLGDKVSKAEEKMLDRLAKSFTV